MRARAKFEQVVLPGITPTYYQPQIVTESDIRKRSAKGYRLERENCTCYRRDREQRRRVANGEWRQGAHAGCFVRDDDADWITVGGGAGWIIVLILVCGRE